MPKVSALIDSMSHVDLEEQQRLINREDDKPTVTAPKAKLLDDAISERFAQENLPSMAV